jgi:hypothetical protein
MFGVGTNVIEMYLDDLKIITIHGSRKIEKTK